MYRYQFIFGWTKPERVGVFPWIYAVLMIEYEPATLYLTDQYDQQNINERTQSSDQLEIADKSLSQITSLNQNTRKDTADSVVLDMQ